MNTAYQLVVLKGSARLTQTFKEMIYIVLFRKSLESYQMLAKHSLLGLRDKQESMYKDQESVMLYTRWTL